MRWVHAGHLFRPLIDTVPAPHAYTRHAKRCWFVESVEEVAQPLRFAARKVATQRSTARTVDFTTMYPCFDQKLCTLPSHIHVELISPRYNSRMFHVAVKCWTQGSSEQEERHPNGRKKVQQVDESNGTQQTHVY